MRTLILIFTLGLLTILSEMLLLEASLVEVSALQSTARNMRTFEDVDQHVVSEYPQSCCFGWIRYKTSDQDHWSYDGPDSPDRTIKSQENLDRPKRRKLAASLLRSFRSGEDSTARGNFFQLRKKEPSTPPSKMITAQKQRVDDARVSDAGSIPFGPSDPKRLSPKEKLYTIPEESVKSGEQVEN